MGSAPRRSAPASKAPTRQKPTTPANPAGPKASKERLAAWKAWRSKADAIGALCDTIVAGGHLADFAKQHGLAYTTVRTWIEADPARAAMYARAREDRSDKLADEIVAISDEQEVVAKHEGDDVRLTLDAAAIQRNRLRVDARKWVAAKLKPRVYGDKLDVTQAITVRDIPDDELLKRAGALLEVLRAKGVSGA